MAKLRHSRLQVKKLSTVTLVLLMLFMLTVVLLMLLGLGIFSLPINDDDSPPNDLASYRCMASERCCQIYQILHLKACLDLAGRLRSENNLLQLVLKHQRIVEELMEENLKLRQILMEDLKIPPSKLQASYSSKIKSPCSECLYCRRKQRRNR